MTTVLGRDSQGGFTLVELMVVVLIIGILVSIAIPVFSAASANAKLRTCMSNQRLIEGAVQQFLSSGQPMWTQDRRLNGNNTPDSADILVPAYIKEAPECPASGLFYWVTAQGTVTGDMSAPGYTAGHSHY